MKLSDVGNNIIREYNKTKYSIKEIFNSDNYCLIRVKVIAIAFHGKDPASTNMLRRPTNLTNNSDKNQIFDFKKEFEDYCRSDVR